MFKPRALTRFLAGGTLALALASTANWAAARDLSIGLRSEPTSMDPMFHALTSNIQLSMTLFDPLVRTDKDAKPVPALAESWSVDGNVWTFKLRPNVKFSDGSDFTAEDVIFSYNRAPKVPNSPSSFSLFLSSIAKVEAPDPLTLKITTKQPAPVLLQNLATVAIMSHKAAAGPAPEGKTTVELNRGDGLVGTGPYKFVSWQRGADIVFERNPNYWGPKPDWDKVIYRPISNSAARVAGLLSGDISAIEDPPTSDVARLRKNEKVHVVETPSLRLIYVALVQGKDVPKGMTDTNGRNPLADQRVREALSLALDRKAIVARVMSGVGKPAGNLMAYPAFGTAKSLAEAPNADVSKAKKLLEEAGYAKGFTMTLGSPAGRYTNDQEIAQAVAAMWARIGVKTNVETMAPSVFFQKRGEYAFSTYLAGWAATSGEMINPLQALLMTKNKDKDWGTTNWSHYSNPELDTLVSKASGTLNDDERRSLLEKAGEMAMADDALLPIQFELSVWGMQKDITYPGRADQMTLAQDFRLKK